MMKLVMFCLNPRANYAGLRFKRTGTQFDYWRHEYWLKGPKGIASMMIDKERLIAQYCAEAYRLRHGLK